MSNNKQQTEVKQIKKHLELPHRETVISTNTLQTKPFDNQKINMSTTTDMMWDEYGNPNPPTGGGDNMNNNPGTLNMRALREYITMYLDDIDAYGEEDELTEATNVLYDFVMYLKSMRGLTEGETDDEQAMIDYNAMEEESEINDIMEMQNGTK